MGTGNIRIDKLNAPWSVEARESLCKLPAAPGTEYGNQGLGLSFPSASQRVMKMCFALLRTDP